MTFFRGLCEECAETEFARLKLWFEVGEAPIETVNDLEDFILGALFSRYGKPGLLAYDLSFIRPIVDGLPAQYVSVSSLDGIHWKGPTRRSGFDCEFAVEIKQTVPADLLRQTIKQCAKWPDARRGKSKRRKKSEP